MIDNNRQFPFACESKTANKNSQKYDAGKIMNNIDPNPVHGYDKCSIRKRKICVIYFSRPPQPLLRSCIKTGYEKVKVVS